MKEKRPIGEVPHSALPGDQAARVYAEGYVASESQIESSSARQNLALWIAVLGSAIVWFLELQTTYPLVEWTCASKNHWVIHVTFLFFLLLAALPGWIAFTQSKLEGSGERQSAGAGRRRFMAVLGLMLSGTFVLLIFAQWIPIFFVDPCLQ